MKYFFYLLLVFHPVIAGNINGIVFDEINDSPMIGANVLLSDLEIGSATNGNGEFVLSNLNEGEYNLQISLIGYETY
jgi:hypothetical protein